MKLLTLILTSFFLLGGASMTFDGSDDHITDASAAVTARPFAYSCWFRTTDANTTQAMLWLGDTATGGSFWRLEARMASSNDNIRSVGGPPTNVFNSATGSVSANTWQHATQYSSSTTDMSLTIDGTVTTDTSGGATPTSVDAFTIGRSDDSTPNVPFIGQLAHCGLWNVDLTDNESFELASGQWTTWVRTEGLVGAYSLFGTSSNVPDLSGNGNHLTKDLGCCTNSALGPPIHWPGGSP